MADIFALQGPAGSGKTAALILLLEKLQEKYPEAAVEYLIRGRRDFKVVVRGVKGKNIGIESQGDPNSRLEQSLADFISWKCGIIFCACRTNGMTVDWVSAMSPPHRVRFVPKTRSSVRQSAVNLDDALRMLKEAGL